MLALSLCAVLLTGAVDDLCLARFGHPGNLGVTNAAEQYFTANATYAEAAATIGALGDAVPSNDANLQIYQWHDGQLEMHFRESRLTMYRMDGRWNVFSNGVTNKTSPKSFRQQSTVDPPPTYEEFYNFYKFVEKIILDGQQVAWNQKEQIDIRSLQFYLTKLRRAIAEGNWVQAEQIRDKIVSLPAYQRSYAVAADAKRRLAAMQRADEERRHIEEMRQRAEIAQAQMQQQQAIINALNQKRNN